MAADPKSARTQDPRYRPFRIGAYAFYLAVVSAFSLLVIRSVVTSVLAMSPSARPEAEVTLSTRECLQRAEALFQELEQERAKLTTGTFPASRTDDQWVRFRVEWMERYRDAESRCGLQSRAPDRVRLRKVFDRLSRVMDLFTTAAVQYAGEIGGAVDEVRASLEEARRDPTAGQLP
jgi:hypothetical protein